MKATKPIKSKANRFFKEGIVKVRAVPAVKKKTIKVGLEEIG